MPILYEILSRCDNKTLQNAKLTCQRWYVVINESIGVDLAIGKACYSTINPPKVPFQAVGVVEQIGVKNCYVGELNDFEGCPFQHPQTVRTIVFDGPISHFNLLTLLVPLPNLSHISFHYSALENANIEHNTLRSVSLKSLKLSSHLVNQYYGREKAESVLQNVITLLQSIQSQQLQTLILDLVYIRKYERELTKAILAVLVRHKLTLKTVQCYNVLRIQEPYPPGEENPDDDTMAQIGECPLVKEEIVCRAIHEAVNIKRICYAGLRDMESDAIWNQLIVSQKNLQEFFYMNDSRDIQSTGLPCLRMNGTTLRKILFHINAVDEMRNIIHFDCGIFKSFPHLSHLLIRGRQLLFQQRIDADANITRFAMKIPILRNVELIPNTVTVLSLRDILVDAESFSKFQACLPPHLVNLRLVDAGSVGVYGIKPETLLELLKSIQLQEIEIIRSFNKTSWEVASGKDIYEEALFYRVRCIWEFHGSRGPFGIFCFKTLPMFDYGQAENTLRANDVCEVVFQ
ncbi:hypothetical protein Ocin01_00809 [Orchesella cincta]|uniref:F-box domain-containing protein n=1 Tax=Orchesella cincta TaxID=48709 RepID=A0A1D2NKV5_ORCCI|nr:hypothetical protein Ocin01_00809 [Orchesella cincta]